MSYMKSVCLLIMLLTTSVNVAANDREINIGVILSTTGAQADMGIPPRNAVALLPKTFSGRKINYIVIDDASDPTTANIAAKKLITKHNVDLILGTTLTPTSLAIIDDAATSGTVVISQAGSMRIIHPMDEKRRWVFKVTQNDDDLINAMVKYMKSKNVKTVAWIGFNNAYAEAWWDVFKDIAEANSISVTTKETYNPTDTSTTAQALRAIGTRPDAVLIVAAGLPAATPHLALIASGYRGMIMHSHGSVGSAFLTVGGKAVEGALAVTGLISVPDQISLKNVSAKGAVKFTQLFESTYGVGSGANKAAFTWDSWKLVENALPMALSRAEPGTSEFRLALRNALENTKNLVLVQGVMSLSPSSHRGWINSGSVVVVRATNGQWKLVYE